jgi:hypothetical protein
VPLQRVRGRGYRELGGEARAGEWRCGVESSTRRRMREIGGRGENECHCALLLHHDKTIFTSYKSHDKEWTLYMDLILEVSFIDTVVLGFYVM